MNSRTENGSLHFFALYVSSMEWQCKLEAKRIEYLGGVVSRLRRGGIEEGAGTVVVVVMFCGWCQAGR